MSPRDKTPNIREVDPSSFGGQLRRLRMDAGLTQEELGEAIGLNQQRISMYERGLHLPEREEVIIDLANALGVSPGTLFESSRREVGLMRETVGYLERYRTAQKARRLQAGPLWLDRNLIFDDGLGGLITPQAAQGRFRYTVERSGVRYLTLHGLRHTMAVTWLQAGESPVVVSKRLGHKSVAFTLNVYAKVSREWQQSAMVRVAAFIKEAG